MCPPRRDRRPYVFGDPCPRWLAANVAAWLVIPDWMYVTCDMMLPPGEQMGSSGVHKLMVLPAYSGLVVGSGWPPHNMVENPLDGSPKSATAAT